MTLGRLLLNLVMCGLLFEWSPSIEAYFRALCVVLIYYSLSVVIVAVFKLILPCSTNAAGLSAHLAIVVIIYITLYRNRQVA